MEGSAIKANKEAEEMAKLKEKEAREENAKFNAAASVGEVSGASNADTGMEEAAPAAPAASVSSTQVPATEGVEEATPVPEAKESKESKEAGETTETMVAATPTSNAPPSVGSEIESCYGTGTIESSNEDGSLVVKTVWGGVIYAKHISVLGVSGSDKDFTPM